MQIEYNTKQLRESVFTAGSTVVAVTPPLDEDYWYMRVPLSETQAMVCFPKFFTFGIGFQREDADWNTNLPWTSLAPDIYAHIKHNKGDDSIKDEDCIAAIEMLQKAIAALQSGGVEA